MSSAPAYITGIDDALARPKMILVAGRRVIATIWSCQYDIIIYKNTDFSFTVIIGQYGRAVDR